MYIFEGIDGTASVILNESSLTDEQKSKGLYVDNIPNPDVIDGKTSILMCNVKENRIWYNYIDVIDISKIS